MKKYLILSLSLCSIFVGGCTRISPISDSHTTTLNTGSILLSGKISQYPFAQKMEKPVSEKITNVEEMQHGFHSGRTKYIGKNDIIEPEAGFFKKECPKITIMTSTNGAVKEVTLDQIEKGNVEITGTYDGAGLFFDLNQQQNQFLNTHGWLVFDPGSSRNVRTSDTPILDQEERGMYYQKIGGSSLDYQRYPYNTVFVTTDMLLHFYHKIFSNSLRYYEESQARTTMADLSTTMFTKFSKLYQQNASTPLAPYYAYAAAYRAVPYALLVPQDEVLNAINNITYAVQEDGMDLSDEGIKAAAMKRLSTIYSQIPQSYKEAVTSTLENIFDASQSRAEDSMLTVLAGTNSNAIDIQQDYTQFTPRSHYTNSSLLKTYFMGMKRFMREKLYFRDIQQTKASLVMINNIQAQELVSFSHLYDFIQKLIGADDDVNIRDIQSFITKKGWTSDQYIVDGVNSTIQTELQTLRPQKIMSTHYQTPDIQMVTEQQAKDELAGFVFFGEKFTIDSWIFDRMTAGTAEKESTYKPSVQTSLIVPDGLVNTGFIKDLVDLRMQQAQTKYGINAAQVAGYDRAKQETQSGVFAHDFGVSTYHQWLNDLGWLFALSDSNRPYFMQDPLRKYKDLNTFQGNYTELKHDTLLYVKQAYAELGGGGGDQCVIYVTPPPLPMPKGYVEPNVGLIDALLTLAEQTKQFFGDDQSFSGFINFLLFTKDIAIKETKNEVIDDANYDNLRLYYNELLSLLYPKKIVEGGRDDFISALIADIFTSEKNGPLYIANGRPYLLITNINDANGTRAVIGPVYSTFEFYESDNVISSDKGRYSDEDRRAGFDTINKKNIYTLPLQKIIQE